VALYYAQRAREVTEKAREDALNEARELVEAKRWVFFCLLPHTHIFEILRIDTNAPCRYASNDKRSIDLHGTCVQEAIVITSEILEREGCSPGKCVVTLCLSVAGHFAERSYVCITLLIAIP
jgi:hypothetical protein